MWRVVVLSVAAVVISPPGQPSRGGDYRFAPQAQVEVTRQSPIPPRPVPFSFQPLLPGAARGLPFSATRLTAWAAAVAHHEPGRRDAAAETVSGWSASTLAELLVDLNDLRTAVRRSLVRAHAPGSATPDPRIRVRGWETTLDDAGALIGVTPAEAARGLVTGILERGAVLHTDIAVFEAEAGSAADVGHELAGTSLHCGFAMALVDSLRQDAPTTPFIAAWYRGVAAVLQLHREVVAAPLFAEGAVLLFPHDPVLLLSAGIVNETLASPTVQAGAYFRDSGLSPVIGPSATYLEQAERYLRRARDADPGMTEARVRLGHVLGRLGRHEEALVELRAAAAATAPPFVTFFASLFAGDEEAACGRAEPALAAYLHALSVFPASQSAWLSVSHVRQRLGDRTGAVEALRRAVEARPGGRQDPWDEYGAGLGRQAPELLRALRTSASGARP
jgi:tetratricopeptide (TPR) repeat protein